VPVTLLRWNGSLLSTILPRGPSKGELRVAQVTAYADPERRLKIACEFIREKVSKTISLAEELGRTFPVSPEPIRKEAEGAQGGSLNDLMLYESRVAQAHWKEYARAVETIWPNSGFVSRRSTRQSWNNSAADPTNALLNYGYSLLASACRSAIFSVGLLPEIGFLHEVAPSKFPLEYDLQEPFRWIVDLSVLEVIRDGKLDPKGDFIVTENYHVRLRLAASKALIDRFLANLNRKVPVGSRSFAFETLILEAGRKLCRHLIAPKTRLDIRCTFAVEDSGFVDSETAGRVASMTYAEGRRLGISRAGLWDLKRRAAEGKPLRLYGKVSDCLG
jgi:CRISPR-associated protein Cas1